MGRVVDRGAPFVRWCCRHRSRRPTRKALYLQYAWSSMGRGFISVRAEGRTARRVAQRRNETAGGGTVHGTELVVVVQPLRRLRRHPAAPATRAHDQRDWRRRYEEARAASRPKPTTAGVKISRLGRSFSAARGPPDVGHAHAPPPSSVPTTRPSFCCQRPRRHTRPPKVLWKQRKPGSIINLEKPKKYQNVKFFAPLITDKCRNFFRF